MRQGSPCRHCPRELQRNQGFFRSRTLENTHGRRFEEDKIRLPIVPTPLVAPGRDHWPAHGRYGSRRVRTLPAQPLQTALARWHPDPMGRTIQKSTTRATDRETMNRRRAHLLWFWSGCHHGGPECPLGGGRGSRLPELPGHGDDPGTDPGRVLHVVRPTTG
jgi:hypothetical protein